MLKQGYTLHGGCVSVDHYISISAVPGRLLHTFGHERQGYGCVTLFVDYASGNIFNFYQFSTSASKTISSKHKLEALAKNEGFSIKSYHSDNGVFVSAAYKGDCDCREQSYFFQWSGCSKSEWYCRTEHSNSCQLTPYHYASCRAPLANRSFSQALANGY